MTPSSESQSPPTRQRLAFAPFGIWLALAVLLGAIVMTGGYTLYYAEAHSYFSDNPDACMNCHIMREAYDGWHTGSHKAVATCNDCHSPHTFPAKYLVKGLNGWNHGVAFTFNSFEEPLRITSLNRDVAYQNCLYCHGDLVTPISHIEGNAPTDCLFCHAGVGHGD
jgi:cytochrome c nitrite reductase small subunit